MATFTYPFTTPGNYTYDSAKITVSGGLAELGEDKTDIYARWHLNQSSGTNVPDDSGNSRNGTTINMEDADWVTGKLGNALIFDGSNEYVNFGDIASFERTNPFSVEFWFRVSSTGVQETILGRTEDAGSGTGWYVQHLSGFLFFNLRNKSTVWMQVRTSTGGYNDNGWHHAVITYNGNSLASGVIFYVDNTVISNLVTSDTLTDTILNTQPFRIGIGGVGGAYYPGYLDEVAIYNRVITASEVNYRWNAGAGTEKFPKWLTDSPTIYKTAGDTDPSIFAFTNFSETTSPSHTGTLAYQLSDDGVNWEYWNGSAWVAAGASDYNSATVVDTNIGDFDATAQTIYVKSFFISDGTQDVGLDLLQIGWIANAPPFVDAGTNKTTKDHTYLAPFSDCDFYDIDGTVVAARYKVDGEVDVWTNIPQGGYGTLLEAVQAFQYLFDNTGVKTVRLQVEDNDTATSEDSLEVTVQKYTVTFNVRDKDTGSHIPNLTFSPGDGSPDQSVSSPFTWDYDWSASDILVSISATGYFPILNVPVPTTDHTENFEMVSTSFYKGFAGVAWDRANSKLIVNTWLESQGRILVSGLSNVELKIEICDSSGSITTLATKSTTIFNARGIAEIEFTLAELGGTISSNELYVVTGTTDYLSSSYSFVHAFTLCNVEIVTSVEKIEDILANRLHITGNQAIIYADDKVTPLYTWDLKDQFGNPTEVNVVERIPV